MRELVAIAVRLLIAFALSAVVSGVISLFLGEHALAGPGARELIDHERDHDPRYYPDPVLLSDRGRRLRRVGLRLVWAGAVALVL